MSHGPQRIVLNGHTGGRQAAARAQPCSADHCLALAAYLPRLVFRPVHPGPTVSPSSSVLMRLPLCLDCAHRLQEHPGRFLTDTRWRELEAAHRETGRQLPDRDEVTVELVPLGEWDRAGVTPPRLLIDPG